jgi:hypothetical protein
MGAIDNAVNRFYFKPYCCDACLHRFYVLRRDVSLAAMRMEIGEWISRFGSRKPGRRTRREIFIYIVAALVVAETISYFSRQRR